MAFYSKNTKKVFIMSEKDGKLLKDNNVSRFYDKEINVDKVRGQCRLTGNYRGPAHQIFNIKITQKQSKLIPIAFHNSSNYDGHQFLKKHEKVGFDIFRNEVFISVTYGCIRFIDSCRFVSMGLDGLVKTCDNDDLKVFKNEFPENGVL